MPSPATGARRLVRRRREVNIQVTIATAVAHCAPTDVHPTTLLDKFLFLLTTYTGRCVVRPSIALRRCPVALDGHVGVACIARVILTSRGCRSPCRPPR